MILWIRRSLISGRSMRRAPFKGPENGLSNMPISEDEGEFSSSVEGSSKYYYEILTR
jgi:hypothetical protein